MTSRISAKSSSRGITLIELLVVLAIVTILAGLSLFAIVRAQRAGEKAAMVGELQAIATALDQYKNDFYDYPRPTVASVRGSEVLVRALIAPFNADPSTAATTDDQVSDHFDGAAGPGFRVRRGPTGAQGPVKGPYLSPETFKFTVTSPIQLLDRGGSPILYYPASGGARTTLTAAASYVGNSPLQAMFNPDNGDTSILPQNVLRFMLGDMNDDGAITSTPVGPESAVFTGPFILWSAGPDGKFGFTYTTGAYSPANEALNKKSAAAVDDVTNYIK